MIRAAVADDVEALVQLIHDLAEYERSPDSVEIESEQLRAALFGDSPTVFAHVADEGGRILGMAIWFLTFSTWTGRNGIYLEDLYVRPEARTRGIGRALLAELASIAHQSGYGRIDWSVLDWNESGHPLLPVARSRTHGRVDRLPAVGPGARRPWLPRTGDLPPTEVAQMVKARLATSCSPSPRSPVNWICSSGPTRSSRPPVSRRNSRTGSSSPTVGGWSKDSTTPARSSTWTR